MKTPSKKTIHLLLIGAALLLALLIANALQRNSRRGNALKTGCFEQVYTSTIDALHTRTKAVRGKLRANMPGDLEILPEELLRRSEIDAAEGLGEPILKNITLRGIYWSNTLPLAEINDRLCKVGDEIAGFTLHEIQPYQIILLDPEGNTNTLSLVKDIFIRRTRSEQRAENFIHPLRLRKSEEWRNSNVFKKTTTGECL